MKTRKLYYEDPLRSSFTARVISCEQDSALWQVELDATVFYPEGGGQAWDTGTLADARVVQVKEVQDRILHWCDRPLQEGQQVEGILDWQQRFGRMQQHTGEHILSGLIHARFGWHNVGFHMGKDTMEVDFDGPISPEALEELEAQVNGILWENRPVLCYYPQESELQKLSYRSKKALDWPVRIVEVQGADLCACCGTHVPFTGQVGLLKIFSAVPLRGGVRLEIACGEKALALLRNSFEENRKVSQCLSAKLLETGEAAQRLKDALAAEKYQTAALWERLFSYIAKDYVNQKNILHFEDALQSNQVRLLAEKLSEVCTGVVAVFSKTQQGYSYCLAQPGGDLRQLCRQMNSALEGRGGGKPPFQQGNVKASREQIRGFFAQVIKEENI